MQHHAYHTSQFFTACAKFQVLIQAWCTQ